MKAAVVTVSDRSFRREREDISGGLVCERLASAGFEVVAAEIVPDEKLDIIRTLLTLADDQQVNLLVTTGGTGAGPRDVTPEATQMVIERPFPGIACALLAESQKHTRFAMLSRGTAGSRGQTLIVNLPGNPKAIEECWPVLEPVLGHACRLLAGKDDPHE